MKTPLVSSKIYLSLALLILPIATTIAHDAPSQDSQLPDKILTPSLQGIRLISPNEQTILNSETKGIQAKGLNLSKDEESKLAKQLYKHFIGKPLTLGSIQELKQEIILFYRSIGHPVVLVIVPEQEMSNSVLVVEIFESKMGKVQVMGNKWFSTNKFKRAIRLKPDAPINANTLVSDLAWLNRNPYCSVNAIYKSGKNPGTTDIELIVKDRFPLSVYTGIDNTGYKDVGFERGFAGLNWGNAFGIDGLLSYQFTTSTTPKEFMSHAASYAQPFPWRHNLLVYGGYSFVDTHLQHHSFKFHGTSIQASSRYQIPLPSGNGFLQQMGFGADFKRTNNSVDFGGFTIIGRLLNLFQYVLEYNLNYNQKNTKLYFETEVFGSPGQTLGDMSNHLYQLLRYKAKNAYFYGRGVFSVEQKIPSDCSLYLRLSGQGSSANLLPSEQLGLGGYNTVRGYYERQINVDDGIITNFEFRTFPIASMYKKNYDLHGLAFVDFAFGQEHKAAGFERQQYYLLGAGPGLRFSCDWLVARLDWGIRILKTQHDGPASRLHFSVIAKY